MKLNKKKFKFLVVISSILILLVAGAVVVKNVLLRTVKQKIESRFDYTDLRLEFFPPSLVIEEARSKFVSPFVSVHRIILKIPSRALWTRKLKVNVFLDHPVLRIYPLPEKEGKKAKDKKRRYFSAFPFIIERVLVREGEVYFWGREVQIFCKGLEALFVQHQNHYELKMESEKSTFDFGDEKEQIKTQVKVFLEGKKDEINLKKLNLFGEECIFKGKGKIINPYEPQFNVKAFFSLPSYVVTDVLNIPFKWEGQIEGEGIFSRRKGRVAAQANFSSHRLILNTVNMGKLKGEVDFQQEKGGRVKLTFLKKLSAQESVNLRFGGEKITGKVQRFHLNPIARYIFLPWPVASPVWGEFTVEKGRVKAELEFRDKSFEVENRGFPFRGNLNLNWNGKRRVSFQAPELKSCFAEVDLNGKLFIGENMDISIQGKVNSLQQARLFTEEFLNNKFKFPSTHGKGKVNLRIFGSPNSPQLYSKFSFSPGTFGEFEVNSVKGQAELIKGEFFGRFKIEDPTAKGQLSLFSSPKELRLEIHLEKGKLETLFPKFNLGLPLAGEASGNFEYKQRKGSTLFQGSFSSPRLKLGGEELTKVKGKISWSPEQFSLSSLNFGYGQGQIEGFFRLKNKTRQFNMDIEGREIALNSVYPGLRGDLNFNLQGKGILGQDKVSGDLEIEDLKFSSLPQTSVKGKTRLTFSPHSINLNIEGNFLPGENRLFFNLEFPLEENFLSGKIEGSFHNFDLVLPWKGVKGKVNYMFDISGKKVSPRIKGAVDFQGSVFPFPRFPHALRDFSGLIFVENNEISLRSLHGELGRGEVNGSGRIELGKRGIKDLNLQFEGKDMILSPLEDTRVMTDANLNLRKEKEQFILGGELIVDRLYWRREFTQKISFYSSPYSQASEKPSPFENLNINLRLRADDNVWIENSLAEIEAKFDFNVQGNLKSPVLLGDVEALGGEIYFQDREFKIVRGEVSFFNPLTIEPYLNFKGESYIKNYRVTFSLSGFLENLRPEFHSSPPLPPEDVLALVAVGESFRRTYSYEKSTQQSTASLLSFQLSKEAEKRAEKLFSIDRFRIDPFILSSSAEMTARLTIGKKITRNFFVYYSTNLTTQTEEIARLEWELTEDLSIVGTREEDGRISFDFKIHKRF